MDYKEKEHQVYLSLGSNLGNREAELKRALDCLCMAYGQVVQSSVYETPPWGFESDLHFLNMCVGFKTSDSAEEVLRFCHEIERDQGRVRSSNCDTYSSRNIDIDVLFYGDKIIKSSHLEVPHPRLYSRSFVLEPLSDIANDFEDPQKKRRISALKKECNDKSIILLYKNKI